MSVSQLRELMRQNKSISANEDLGAYNPKAMATATELRSLVNVITQNISLHRKHGKPYRHLQIQLRQVVGELREMRDIDYLKSIAILGKNDLKTFTEHPPIFEFVGKRICRYKLLKNIGAMPEGKRKYILLHKRAYDSYQKLKSIPDMKRTKTESSNIMVLYDLMKNLKLKINEK